MSEEKMAYKYYATHTGDILAAAASLIKSAQDGDAREAELSYVQDNSRVEIKVKF